MRRRARRARLPRRPGARRGAARRSSALAYVVFVAAGTSEDIAMLLAYEPGAELIVAVGTHVSMVEFLDKGRAGMASTFLVRLKVGADPRRRQGREPALREPDRERDDLAVLPRRRRHRDAS